MTQHPSHPTRVAIVDDDAGNRELLAELLTAEGFQVVGTAADGAQGVALAEDLRPDVALVDLLMPVMDGLEATRRIRAAGLSTEVVILTFYAELLSTSAPEAGAYAYLVKGCSVELLLEVIAQAGRRASERRARDRPAGGSHRTALLA